ncbi:hypothetical protein BD560DRAFT_441391 [Blakeslea trispora]|nr:hypothetical protein BD560DRAFT_441391 [Blakeslea trispora]
MLRRHRWMESNIKKYVQSVLHNRLKYLKQADKDAKKGDLKRHASLIARMLQPAVLVSEMMSDQEEELDAENKPVPFRLAPTYRSIKPPYSLRLFYGRRRFRFGSWFSLLLPTLKLAGYFDKSTV